MNALVALGLSAAGGWISGYLAAWVGRQTPPIRLEVATGGAIVGLGFGVLGAVVTTRKRLE